jgi:hypothetical protein
VIQIAWAVDFAVRSSAGRGFAGSDMYVLLFIAPFYIAVVATWRVAIGRRALPFSKFDEPRIQCRLKMGARLLAVAWVLCVFLIGAQKRYLGEIPLLSAAIGWAIVLVAGPIGYLVAPTVAQQPGYETPRETESALPSRKRPQQMERRRDMGTLSRSLGTSVAKFPPLSLPNELLLQVGASMFIAKPKSLTRACVGIGGTVILGFAVAMIYYSVSRPSLSSAVEKVLVAGILLAFSFIFLAKACLGDRSVEFDVHSDEFTYGPPWARSSCPLNDVVAVQFVEAPLARSRGTGRRGWLCQINLIVGHESRQLINVIYRTGPRRTFATAQQIATALNLPLIGKFP